RQETRGRARRGRDAMQEQVIGVVPEMTVREPIHVLLEDSISGVPVLDSEGRLIGVVTATEVLGRAAEGPAAVRGRFAMETGGGRGQFEMDTGIAREETENDIEQTEIESLPQFSRASATPEAYTGFDDYRVRDIMTAIPFTLRPTDTLEDAARLFLGRRIHHALVVEDGALRGVITPFDLIGAVEW